MIIIPAIDIIDGKCVRLTHGDFNAKTVYAEDPLDMALRFQDAGLSRLHLVDLDGARTGAVKNLKVLERIASLTNLSIDFGGGIKTRQVLDQVFSAGADFVSVGSVAVKSPDEFLLWVSDFGPDRFLLGADVIGKNIAINGWIDQTAIHVLDFIHQFFSVGIKTIFCTDVSKDGAMQGPSIDLYKEIISANTNVNLIASGGVSSMDDLVTLKEIGCYGAIVGKAIYEGKIELNDLIRFNYAN